MWWGIGVALLFMVGFLGFYIFAFVRLRTIQARAPASAKPLVSAAMRASLAFASQKLGFIAILLFLGLRQDESALEADLWWIVLLVVVPTGWTIVAAVQQGQAKSKLDTEADAFVRSLDDVPALPWKRTL